MSQTRFRVEGMDCAGCAAKVDAVVRRLPGVDDVSVSVTTATMTVRHGGQADLNHTIEQKVGGLGYRTTPIPEPANDDAVDHDHGHSHHDHDHGHQHDAKAPAVAGHDHKTATGAEALGLHGHDHGPTVGPWWASAKGRLTIADGVALAAAWVVAHMAPALTPWVFVAAMLVGLVPIARRAVMAAVNGMPFTVETLMTIAAVGAVAIGAGDEGASVVFLFLVGELLEGVAAGKARASISGLTGLIPATALLEEDGQVREVPAETLPVGSTILVRPGDRISADGEILSGDSAVDEASVTGESVPVRKGPGARVFAGTVNGEAALRVRVAVAAADNTVARVVRLVEEAQESKAPTERFIDRFSRYYTPGVLAAGALVATVPPLLQGGSWSEWIYKGLAILLIGCPCALVISTPAAIASALSAGARRGLLMKGGAVLETLGKVTTVAMDKTGTLTAGKPRVTDIVAGSRPEGEVVALAAALETGSSHPLAMAILAEAAARGLQVQQAEGVTAVGGKGVTGRLAGTELFLGSAKAAGERTALPAEVATAVEAFNAEGKTVSILLTGRDIAGLIAMRDEPRPDAQAGVQGLRNAVSRWSC